MKKSSFFAATAILAATTSVWLSGPVAAQEGELISDPVTQAYMQTHGVDHAEAERRLATLQEIARVESALASKFPEQFGGLYVQHEPQFRVVAKMTGNGQGLLKQVTDNPLFVVEQADRPVKQMIQLRDRATAQLAARKIAFDSDVNVWTGEILIDVIDYDMASAAIGETIKGLNYVKLRRVSALPQNTATIYGGRQGTGTVQYCTTGFSVKNATQSGVLTAGHCDNSMTVAGSSLTLGGELYASSTTNGQDAQWMIKSTNTYPNEIYTSSTARMAITQVYDPNNLPLDWDVCAYGYNMSVGKCGKLKSKYQSTTDNNGITGKFFRVSPATTGAMVVGGDSGGPVYGNNTAYGIIKGHGGTTYPNDMYFMSIADITPLGITVKTAP